MKSYVTVLSTDSYLEGVLVLNQSLEDQKSKHPLTVLVTDDLSESTYCTLESVEIPYIISQNDIEIDQAILLNNISKGQPHWNNTFFKLKIVNLVQFEKIVFLDCDMIILKNIDHLFEKPHMSGVIAGKSFRGNEGLYQPGSGLLVIEPKVGLLEDLIDAVHHTDEAKTGAPIGDENVFHMLYPNWPDDTGQNLSETYNLFFPHLNYYISKKICRFKDVYVIHFVGEGKPWNQTSVKNYLSALKSTLLFQKVINFLPSFSLLHIYSKTLRRVRENY